MILLVSAFFYNRSHTSMEEQAIRKRDRRIATLRYITYVPRSLAERLLGTPRYKRMVASIKGLLPKGRKK